MPAADRRFPRKHRLRSRDFAAVLHEGKVIRGRGLAILVKNNLLSIPRLGLIVPKRVAKRSVERSRLKRVLREWFRHSRERLEGRDCVVRLTAPQCDERALIGELDRLLGRNRQP